MEFGTQNNWSSFNKEEKKFHNHGVKKSKTQDWDKRKDFIPNLSMINGKKGE